MVKWTSAFGLSNDNKWRWWMHFPRSLQVGSSALAWSKGQQPSGTVLHSSCEVGELNTMTLSHDVSTINISQVL